MRGEAKLFLIGLTLFVGGAIAAGFLIIPSPTMQRVYDRDQKRVDALDSLASAINVFFVKEHRVPDNLAELEKAVPWSAEVMKSADEAGNAYTYEMRAGVKYRLCTTFGAPSPKGATGLRVHPEGPWCEERTPVAAAR